MWKDEGDPGLGDECGSPGADKSFIKGPWTAEEDQLLTDYVEKHGEGNWNAVQQHSGLSRCGKSCRLRWVNHLRPDLKKGAFTEEEEEQVIRMHALYGNKWARMAVEIRGRTDNEIKNFWNTRLKRLQRLGLPMYPDGIRNQAMLAAQTGQNPDTSAANGQEQEDELMLPLLDFKLLQHHKRLKHYEEMINSIPMPTKFRPLTIIAPNVYIQTTPPNMEPGTTFPVPGSIDIAEQYSQLWNSPSSYMPMHPSSSYRQISPEQPSSQVFGQRDNHFLGYDKYFSSSMSLNQESEKLELPSIQRFDPQEVPDEWGIHPNESMSIFDKLEPIPTSESMLDFDESMPALESYDTLHQSSFVDQRPYDFDSGFYDETFGLHHNYESNGGKVANYTHSESPQIEPFSLEDTKMAYNTPFEYPQIQSSAPVNAAVTRTGHNSERMEPEPSSSIQSDNWDGVGSECSDERHVSEEDWFRRLVRKDRQ